jgi:mannose-1-phosphate guanylyltransferase
MLPLGKRPLLEYVLSSLKNAGITEAYLAVGYLHEQIKEYFGDGSSIGMSLHYSVEESERGTAGCILPLREKMGGTFVVMMGDHLSNLDIGKAVEFHQGKRALATIALNRKGVPLEYGVADLKGDEILRFREKPIVENFVNAGVYVFEPEVFEHIKPGEDFAAHVFPRLLQNRLPVFGYIFSDYWLDIGRTTDYEHINQLISVIDLTKGMK